PHRLAPSPIRRRGTQPMPPGFAETTPVDDLRAAVYRNGRHGQADGHHRGTRSARARLDRWGKLWLARDIATRNLVTARRRERLPVAVRRMVRAGVRQLPVVDADAAGALVGLLRRTDALAAFDRVESAAEAITTGSGQPPTAPAPSSRPAKRQG
ncbi:MAG: CBS domain-containing protein, partial [Ktedonobacterales bacterium]